MELIDFQKEVFKKEAHKDILWLKENGYIRETGEYRDGEAILEITEKGKKGYVRNIEEGDNGK